MAATSSAAPAMAGSATVLPRPARKRFATSPAPAALIAHGHRTVAEVDAAELDGLTIADAAQRLGLTVDATRKWLTNRGCQFRTGIVHRIQPASAIHDAITDRVAAAPPSAPCFLCGAARQCEHR